MPLRLFNFRMREIELSLEFCISNTPKMPSCTSLHMERLESCLGLERKTKLAESFKDLYLSSLLFRFDPAIIRLLMVIAEDLLNEYLYSVFGSKKSHVHSFPSLLQPAWAALVLCKRGAATVKVPQLLSLVREFECRAGPLQERCRNC